MHESWGWDDADVGSCVSILGGHSDMLKALALSPDGRFLCTASADHSARVWRTADASLVAVLRGHSDAVSCALISAAADCCSVYTGSFDGLILEWSVPTADRRPDGTPAANSEEGGRRLGAAEGRAGRAAPARALRGHRGQVKELEVAADAERLYSLSEDATLRCWRVADGTCVLIMHGESGAQLTFTLSADSRWAFVSAAGDAVAVWRTADGTLFHQLEGHAGLVWVLCRAARGPGVFSGSEDATVRQWRAPTPPPLDAHGSNTAGW